MPQKMKLASKVVKIDLIIIISLPTVFARDRGLYKVKKAPENTNAQRETQMHAGKWARA
jgi:hypothetical protein